MNVLENESRDFDAEHQGDLRPSRMRFSLTTMIVTISLACLVMGNIISAGKWYYETQALKRELAIAERTTGYLVVDDPTKIQVTKVGTQIPGVWQFQFYLPEGRSYRLCHRMGNIPREGSPEKDPRVHVTDLGSGRVHLSFWLECAGENEWKIHRRGTWWQGSNGTELDTSSVHSTTLDWLDAGRHSFLNKVFYRQEPDYSYRYFLIDSQGVTDTRLTGHRSYDPSVRVDLIKIRVTEILDVSDEERKKFPLDNDIKALEENNEIPEISDGIQLWIEPVPIP